MKRAQGIGVLLLAPALLFAQPDRPVVAVVVETELGAIEIELDFERAPRTAANFLRYVEAGLFDGAMFYRTVRADNQPDSPVTIAVIQGGLGGEREDEGFEAIAMESTDETGLLHRDGVVSMARLGPDTARGEFFICVGDQPELDFGGARNPNGFGFTAFGRVTAGMEVVHAIHQAPAEQQQLEPSIPIERVRQQP